MNLQGLPANIFDLLAGVKYRFFIIINQLHPQFTKTNELAYDKFENVFLKLSNNKPSITFTFLRARQQFVSNFIKDRTANNIRKAIFSSNQVTEVS